MTIKKAHTHTDSTEKVGMNEWKKQSPAAVIRLYKDIKNTREKKTMQSSLHICIKRWRNDGI